MLKGCRNTHIALVQCGIGNVADKFIKAMEIASDEVECLSLKLKILSKYLSMMYCYKTLDAELTYAYMFDTSTITDTQVSQIQTAIDALGIYYTSTDPLSEYLYVWSYTVNASHHANILAAIASVLGATVLSATNIVSDPDYLLNLWNCITYDEFCNIINHAYSLIDSIN